MGQLVGMGPDLSLKLGAGGDTPDGISGLSLWLDVGVVYSGTVDGADVAGGKKDRTGLQTLDPTTAPQTPNYKAVGVNGRPSLVFTPATHDALHITPGPPIETDNGYFNTIVFKPVTTPAVATYGCLNTDDAGNFGMFFRGPGATVDQNKADFFAGSDHHTSAFTLDAWHIVSVNASSAMGGAQLYKDRVAEGGVVGPLSANTGRVAQSIGSHAGTEEFSGEIAEIISYNRQLTVSEIATVHKYLQGKYGI